MAWCSVKAQGVVNRQNGRMCGSGNSHMVREYKFDSPKLKVRCALSLRGDWIHLLPLLRLTRPDNHHSKLPG